MMLSWILKSPRSVAATPSAQRKPTSCEMKSKRPKIQASCVIAAEEPAFDAVLPALWPIRSSTQVPAKNNGQIELYAVTSTHGEEKAGCA